jgi:multiple antibiotic resistance protein
MELWLNALIALLVVIDPVGVAATYSVLTRHDTPEGRIRVARMGVLIAGGILYFFAFTGHAFLVALGITIPAIRIAGGILLFVLATEMILVRQPSHQIVPEPEQLAHGHRRDIAVFPLAIPYIAGPGAITSVVLLMGGAWERPWTVLGVFIVIGFALGLTYVSLRLADRLMRRLGSTGAHVVGRVLGILLAALAVQFVLDGLHGAGLLPRP